MDVDAYLRRIGYPGPVRPSVRTLRDLHVAHQMSVPFENLDVMAGRRVRYDLGSVFDKVVRQGRGGWCLELNPLFVALLRELGFHVEQYAAGVKLRRGGFSSDIEHMVLCVHIAGQRWLADVGFGGMSFVEPIELADHVQSQQGCRYRVHEVDGYQLLERKVANRDWQAVYRFTTRPREFADFDGVSDFHETSPQSPFTQRLICSRSIANGRVVLIGQQLTVVQDGYEEERELPEEEYRDLLDRLLRSPSLSVS